MTITKFRNSTVQRLCDYIERRRSNLASRVKDASGEWKERVPDILYTEYLRVRPLMLEVTPAAIGDYAVLFGLMVEYLTERPCMLLINNVRQQVQIDLENYDRQYRAMLDMNPAFYTAQERCFIAEARRNILYGLEPLH